MILLVPLIPYILTALWTFRCVDPDRFQPALRAHQLPESWDEEEGNVRRAILGEIGSAYSKNEPLLLDKAKYLRRTLVATISEAVLVVLALVLYRVL